MLAVAALSIAAAAASQLTIVAFYPASQLPQGPLTIRGTFSALSVNGTTWQESATLAPVGTDQFAVTLPLESQDLDSELQFKLLAGDGTWQVGCNEVVTVPSSSFPSSSSSFTHTVFPFFSSLPGRYTYARGLFSPQLNNTRDLVVYLPPGYDENPYRQYYAEETLVMHDGQNLFNASTATYGVAWLIQDTLDAMILNGSMRPVVVVGVDNTDARIYEYTYSSDPTVPQAGGGADLYLDFLEQTVLPVVQGAFRVNGAARPGQGGTAPPRWGILGSSLGGLLSCYAGWTRPSVWGGFVGCMSSSFWWNSQDFNTTILPRGAKNGSVPTGAFYLDSGDSGPGNDDKNETMLIRDRLLTDYGYSYSNDSWPVSPAGQRELGYYLDIGGQHSEAYWGARFHVPMTFAYGRPLVLSALPAAAAALD